MGQTPYRTILLGKKEKKQQTKLENNFFFSFCLPKSHCCCHSHTNSISIFDFLWLNILTWKENLKRSKAAFFSNLFKTREKWWKAKLSGQFHLSTIEVRVREKFYNLCVCTTHLIMTVAILTLGELHLDLKIQFCNHGHWQICVQFRL